MPAIYTPLRRSDLHATIMALSKKNSKKLKKRNATGPAAAIFKLNLEFFDFGTPPTYCLLTASPLYMKYAVEGAENDPTCMRIPRQQSLVHFLVLQIQ